jgi:hypothetical protein
LSPFVFGAPDDHIAPVASFTFGSITPLSPSSSINGVTDMVSGLSIQPSSVKMVMNPTLLENERSSSTFVYSPLEISSLTLQSHQDAASSTFSLSTSVKVQLPTAIVDAFIGHYSWSLFAPLPEWLDQNSRPKASKKASPKKPSSSSSSSSSPSTTGGVISLSLSSSWSATTVASSSSSASSSSPSSDVSPNRPVFRAPRSRTAAAPQLPLVAQPVPLLPLLSSELKRLSGEVQSLDYLLALSTREPKNTKVMVNFGYIYHHGLFGTPKDKKKASEYYRRAP